MVQSDLTPPQVLENSILHNDKKFWLIDTGVPHLVTFDADIEHFDMVEARELREKYNANVNIATVLDDGNLRVRTYERGVENETLAGGTGMAACFYRAYSEGWIASEVEVYPTSGDTLYLGLKEETITFRGEVTPTFVTEWRA